MQIQSSFKEEKGKLYLAPTPIGNLEDITLRAERILQETNYIAAEDTRTGGIMLDRIGIHNKVVAFHKFNSKQKTPELVQMMKEGAVIAEISDAGMPVTSDPDYILIQECIKANVPVVPLPGPSAFATALIASGFDAQLFTYYGFLPRKTSERRPYFEAMSQVKATVIFYETPHRLTKTLATLVSVLDDDRQIVCARKLTEIHEELVRGSIKEVLECLEQVDPRGEFVVLVSPNIDEAPKVSTEELVKLVDQLVATGASKKDAIRQVAKQNDVSKNDLCDFYHQG